MDEEDTQREFEEFVKNFYDLPLRDVILWNRILHSHIDTLRADNITDMFEIYKNVKSKNGRRVICAICRKRIYGYDHSNIFSYSVGWKNGPRESMIDKEDHVCDDCRDSRLRRWIANKIANIKH